MACERMRVAQSGTGMRADDLADRGLGLVARRDEAVGLRGEADAVREHGHGEIVDVVGDAVVAAAQERARARGVRRGPSPRGSRRRARAAATMRVARMSAWR